MEEIRSNWEALLAGNERFRGGHGGQHPYPVDHLEALADIKQRPIAAVLACSDSRITPEIIFDQPLGSLFSCRVPGNAVADSARWALEMAVTELDVPLVVVMGHTGCLAISQIIDGKIGGPGGPLRMTLSRAVHRAKIKDPTDVWREAISENARLGAQEVYENLYGVRRAVERGQAAILSAVYDMPTGAVHALDWITKDSVPR